MVFFDMEQMKQVDSLVDRLPDSPANPNENSFCSRTGVS
jgi:tetrahydromethanopterin S-methyltransferase subunit B